MGGRQSVMQEPPANENSCPSTLVATAPMSAAMPHQRTMDPRSMWPLANSAGRAHVDEACTCLDEPAGVVSVTPASRGPERVSL